MSLELKGAQKGRITSHKELIVWQKAMRLAKSTYSLTASFPLEERFGLVSQIRRAAVSIPSNIAEGRARGSRKDFTQFLHIALGSAAELETQIELSKSLSFGKNPYYNEVESLLNEVRRMLITMIASLKAQS